MDSFRITYYILLSIYFLLLLSGFFLLLTRWKKLDTGLNIFLYLYVTVLIIEILAFFLSMPFIYHIEQLIEYTCITIYYYRIINIDRRNIILKIGSVAFYIFFFWYYVVIEQNFFSRNHVDSIVVGVLISLYSVVTLIKIYLSDEDTPIRDYSVFWISVANLVYYPSRLLALGYLEYLKLNKYESLYYISIFINAILNYILYTLYIKAFLCPRLTKKLH